MIMSTSGIDLDRLESLMTSIGAGFPPGMAISFQQFETKANMGGRPVQEMVSVSYPTECSDEQRIADAWRLKKLFRNKGYTVDEIPADMCVELKGRDGWEWL